MAQDRFTKIISMIKWIRTSRLSTKNSLSRKYGRDLVEAKGEGTRAKHVRAVHPQRHLFGFQVWGFGFRVSGFGFRVSGFGSRVSGFGIRGHLRQSLRVWGSGFRV